ncbi:MAG: flavodoxin-dependent (E)-4-hydroxy-3-methylbut-2-enyl-diphosphate synthase [Thermincola sp.]|nr:flavodoxin-dependent (E)-4-hydroxy-3-methylbut-2-enyl-diphosphate synthase [Thermincola sp.]MDT3701749.1 flavodoxin-dependent (E)-4-hydroxy-3-methylbut-2-enyl-diphosphate synthase [Thermincola sp.]
MQRRLTRQIMVGSVPIGGNAPVAIQSMTNTDTRDVDGTVSQIEQLAAAGCEIIRVAVPDSTAADALRAIKKRSPIPVIADIHFDYKLALQAIANGVDGLRLNPGNIGDEKRVREVVKAASERRIPIRIGVNAGSLSKDILSKYNGVTPHGLYESAMEHVRILEDLDFRDIKISLKAFEIPILVQAYELMSQEVDYPLHIGVTEAGTPWAGTIRSAVGIGALLTRGIGDTLRVSLTGEPVLEVKVGWQILKSIGLRQRGPVIVACPTCGRTEIKLIQIAEEVEQRIQHYKEPVKIAIMGCVVNGPGEAREADIGIAGGRGVGLLFKKGEIIKKVPEADMVDELIREIDSIIKSRSQEA